MLEFFLTDEQQITGFKDAGDYRVKNMIELGGVSTNKKEGNHRKAFFNGDNEFWFFIEHGLFLVEVFP